MTLYVLVLSLLAITVSAYPGLGSDGQDLEESQGILPRVNNSFRILSPRVNRDLRVPLSTQDELKAEYKEVILLMNTLAGEFGSIKATITLVKESRDDTKAQLEDDDLSDEQRLTLEKQLGDYETELGELFSQLTIHSSIIQMPGKSMILSGKNGRIAKVSND
ncbi:hypothetical protein BASA83_002639 [Batrachochytrium salamandrivorans]|nr:hypothetical protein BASA83_002639 [Batrachochytrium salamandrivorans]